MRDQKRLIDVDVYNLASREPGSSLSDSIVRAQRAALATLQQSNDLAAAIATFRPSVPQLTTPDLQALTPEARRAVAWYTGLLAQTLDLNDDTVALLQGLRAAAPQDSQIRALIEHAFTWMAALNPPVDAPTVPVAKSSLATGDLDGVIARTPRHVVTARWCGTMAITNGSRTPDRPTEPGSIAEAHEACISGNVILAIHDARDMKFERYVPITKSEDSDQEYVDAIVMFGDTAVVSIERRYANASLDNLVSVDLESGTVLARSTRFLRRDPLPTKAVACMAASCSEINPLTLEPGTSPLADAVVTLSDDRPKHILPPGSPYAFSRRGELLEARDGVTNDFVCAWPGFPPRYAMTLLHNAYDDTLVSIETITNTDALMPSAVINLPALIAQARDCGLETAQKRAGLNLAMQQLQ